MTLREHLHRWLHPRDPLLEAWKDDPFVEVMVARERKHLRNGSELALSLLLQRWGCLPVFFSTITLFACVVVAKRTIYHDEAIVIFVACLLFVLLIRQALVLLRRLFLRNVSPKASFLILLHARGPNPLILDLWMCGVRGRDMVKAMHVILCKRPMRRGLWIFGVVLVLPILGWEPISRIGPAGIVTYGMLAIWFRLVYVHLRYGSLNPLNAVIERYPGVSPKFVEPSLYAGVPVTPVDSRDTSPGVSGLFVLIALILPMIYGNLHTGPSLVGPVGLFAIQVGSLTLANLIMIFYRLGPEDHFAESLEESFYSVDSAFDCFVREDVLQDPDARRVE